MRRSTIHLELRAFHTTRYSSVYAPPSVTTKPKISIGINVLPFYPSGQYYTNRNGQSAIYAILNDAKAQLKYRDLTHSPPIIRMYAVWQIMGVCRTLSNKLRYRRVRTHEWVNTSNSFTQIFRVYCIPKYVCALCG